MATSRPSSGHPSRSSRPLRSSRLKVQSYHEDSSSDELPNAFSGDESGEEELRRLSLSLRPRRSNRTTGSYREDSTDGSLGDFPSDDADAVEAPQTEDHNSQPLSGQASNNGTPPRRRNRTVKTRSQTSRSKRPLHQSLELGKPKSKRRKVEVNEIPLPSSGVIPPWQHLPYHILLDIFFYASRPLVDENRAVRLGSSQWLAQTAVLCRAFHEPALAALYYSPPLLPAAKSHGLLNLLCMPQESLSTNYVNKIKEFHVDVETLLLYKSGPTLGYFELSRLVEKTPQVKTLRLYHSEDYAVGIPPWQRTRSKWGYPESLFESITASSIRLRSWDWNCRFIENPEFPAFALTKHLHPAFRSLRELRLLHVSSEEYDDEDAEGTNEREVVLATAIKELPELSRLVFMECTIVNEHLLPNLPTTLTSLTLNNCDEVTTWTMSAFLASHGQQLRELTLSHNRHLSMSFITCLADCCQNLEKFKMDISMYDSSSYHDVEPHFPELLRSTEVPTWPATLQDIELVQLRKWDDAAAEVLFTSLINAAPDLRNLRRLVISAILKIGWRDRATFREKWIGRLEQVFLRRSLPPDPNLCTLQRPPHSEPLLAEGTTAEDTPHSDAPNSGPPTPSKRKSARLAERKLSEIEEAELSASSSQAPPERFGDQPPPAVQDMCNVVMVRIDNQRPTETQFNEGDFLDDEASGDEDWNGNDYDVAAEGYAW